MPRKKKEETVEETQAEVTTETAVAETETPAAEAAAEEKPKRAAKAKAEPKAETPADAGESQDKRKKRAERIGVVWSDKMTKTVVVRVDRLVKHPMYRKYVKKRKKLMAHNGIGAAEGDKVRIVETRPLSARKRWRVVEIIQKAER
jgi:small subunit ribosomal protein S17